jgi:ribosomal protein S18 acetylase RimI-like enzyme
MDAIEEPAARPARVRKATEADLSVVVKTLTRAFHNDPVMSYIFPDEGKRPAILEAFFDVSARQVYLGKGESYVCEDGQAAALWAPPGKWKVSTLEIVRNGPRLARVMGRRLALGLRAMNLVERKHPHDPPHYYLAILGTDPGRQNRGLGSALLSDMLTRSDAEGLAAYLEASSENNRRLYERHGFRVVEELPMPGGGPPVWRMWRDVGGSPPSSA